MELLLFAYFAAVAGGFGLLWWSGDLVVRYAVEVAHAFKVTTFFIGFIVLALAAAIPELAVAITSALQGVSEVSAGDLIGANFFDVALIVGSTLLIAGRVLFHKKDSKKLVRMLGLTSIVMMIVFMLESLTRVHGLILIGIYLASVLWVWKYSQASEVGSGEEQVVVTNKWGSVCKLFGSFTLVMLASCVTVQAAVALAQSLNLPLQTMGATIVALGTSLPEVVLCLSALRRKQYSLALAPTLGTVFEQSTLILGVLSLLSDKPVQMAGLKGASLFMFLSFFIICYGLHRFSQIGRKTGATLVSLFFAYLAYQFSLGGIF